MPPSIVLTGAPTLQSLSWDATELLSSYIEPVARFAGLLHESDGGTASAIHPSIVVPTWRELPLHRQHLPTGFSQQSFPRYVDNVTSAGFLSASDLTLQTAAGDDNLASQFYEHSFAVHEDATPELAIAPIAAASGDVSQESMTDSNSSFSSDPGSSAQPDCLSSTDEQPGARIPLTDLASLPQAAALQRRYRPAIFINVVVGIVSISGARPIQTRRGDVVDLVEVVTGDDTQAGFTVNFWLPPTHDAADRTSPTTRLRQVLESLRTRDIVLLRHVALSSFRGKVYGQSVRGRPQSILARHTTAQLLFRTRLDRADRRGCYALRDLATAGGGMPRTVVMKTRDVREWVLRFVGATEVHTRGDGRRDVLQEILPVDSQ